MTTSDEFASVTAHIHACTGDPLAWTRGLTPSEINRAVTAAALPDHPGLTALVAKIRGNHPSLFDRNGVPIAPGTPAAPFPGHQSGVAAAALQKAENDLAQQNSTSSTLDLMVISAILNAHAVTGEGALRLQALQREVDNAVQNRTDLNTVAGARDFQRFLIGKLREIATVVHDADLDDRSKATLATAWTALYESSKDVTEPVEARPSIPPSDPSVGTEPSPPLPAYGSDLPMDPLFDPFANIPVAPPLESVAHSVPQPTPSSAPMAPPMTIPSAGLPSGGGQFGAFPPASGQPRHSTQLPSDVRMRDIDDGLLNRLLAESEPLPDSPAEPTSAEPGEDPPGTNADDAGDEADANPDLPAPESTAVQLPDGERIDAPNPELASALRAALSGTPVTEAFHRAGIPIPPPGTAVDHPIDIARIGIGDVGMFTDRQAVAVDRHRVLLDGQIQPAAAVSGPSFLGWLHPPDPQSSASTAPNGVDKPAQTRPAAVAGYAR